MRLKAAQTKPEAEKYRLDRHISILAHKFEAFSLGIPRRQNVGC